MELLHKTRGNAPINGKQLIFVHAADQDSALRDKTSQIILDAPEGDSYAVLYLPEGEDFEVDFDSPELSRIHLYVPIITQTYLDKCGDKYSFKELNRRGISVLPVVENADLIPKYNKRFNNIHAVTLTMQNPGLEIEKLLSRMLVNADLLDEIIRDAFTRKLFLSYRKKDKAEVVRIMKAVHKTRWAKAAAIWFDDFLDPGTDFERGINEAMIEADAVVFAVTNNLPAPNAEGKKNYVCEFEYPGAVQLGKKQIAVEAEPTPRKALEDALGENFPECVPVDDEERMNAAFDKLGGAEPVPDPYILYLRAMAYLLGFRVERDLVKAVDMLAYCADLGVVEAALQLSEIYAYGLTVKDVSDKNAKINVAPKKAVKYRQKAYENAQKMDKGRKRLELMSEILLGDSGIAFDPKEGDAYYSNFIQIIDSYVHDSGKPEDDELKLWLAESYINLGNVENHPINDEETLFSLYAYLKMAEKKLESVKNHSAAYYRVYAMLYSLYSSFERMRKDKRKFGAYESMQAVMMQMQAVHLEPTWYARWRLASYSSNALGCKLLENRDGSGVIPQSDVQECIDEYEKLYSEKKDPQLGTELIEMYRNMQFTSKDKTKKREYLDNAYNRLQEVGWDFPLYPPLREMENRLLSQMPWVKYQQSAGRDTRFTRAKGCVLTALDKAIIPLGIVAAIISVFAATGAWYNFGMPIGWAIVCGIPGAYLTYRIVTMKAGWHILLGCLAGIAIPVAVNLLPVSMSSTVRCIIFAVTYILIIII